MKRTHTRLVVIIGLCSVTMAIALLLLKKAPERTTYEGHPLSYWFTRLQVTVIGPQGSQVMAAEVIKVMGQEYGSTGFGDLRATEVMEFFGTNAIPFLLRKLEGRDSAIEKGVTAAASKAGINSVPFRNAELERSQAVTGLICLKTLPQDALHLISTLSTNSEPEIAGAASYVLKRCSATRRDNTHTVDTQE